MKISPSLLQTIGLALLIPCTIAAGDVHAGEKKKKTAQYEDTQKTKSPKKETLKPIKADSLRLKKLPRLPYGCPACGMG